MCLIYNIQVVKVMLWAIENCIYYDFKSEISLLGSNRESTWTRWLPAGETSDIIFGVWSQVGWSCASIA